MSTRGYIVGAVGIAMVAVSALTAMTTATAAEPAQVGRYSTVDAAQTGSAVDASYLISVRAISAGSNISRIADADVIAMGKTFCSAIDAGITATDFKTSADLMGIPRGTYRAVLATSEAFYCPSHLGVSF